ncbi:short-chain dehydrogenase [Brevibacillus choshinensis]|uniref:Short-chain dehydrogenase n=1 Tax=Brevibacillus choshinensis TaxID=54911 RepID=A0ABR5N6P4_BRECH|nr:oxidoreductase [Brevibacillus choshinensis]KQL46313.1 short-chain dehydrogenase [Brevibacillus choshinensis]
MQKRPVALVTGASSGFGKHSSYALVKAGFTVIASMRDVKKRGPLDKIAKMNIPAEHMEVISLDVTSQQQIEESIRSIIERHGRIDLLVNNAGYACGGFTEELSAEDWRKQFDVNVFGLIDVTRAVLPHMREQRCGRIINISSISGRFGFPGLAPYAASKHAVEGFSESLRLELRPFGIYVSLIEPGSYRTSIWQKGLEHTSRSSSSPYAVQMQKLLASVEQIIEHAPEPDEVIATIVHAATTPKPRLRYPIGRGVKLTIAMKNLLPWKWIEAIVVKKMN